jgi:nucleotide-binding universal stress UspA family protein
MRSTRVIVGVDGSPHSRQAVRWAAAETARRGGTLNVIHAFHTHWATTAFGPDRGDQIAATDAQKVVNQAVEDARLDESGIDVSGATVHGGAAKAILDAAEPGDLIVVGSRGHSQLAAALTGSTCQQVATHAGTSVVVVRGRQNPGDGPVVVGFDGSPPGSSVLEAAFEAANDRSSGLAVIHAFRHTMPAWPASAPPPETYNPRTTRDALIDELTRVTRPLADKYPGVAVQLSVVDGDPAQVLVDASHRGQLVVVGSRGHGGFTGLLLGSVGLHLMHHAHCPVLIARS